MSTSVAGLIDAYDPTLPLAEASTIPASWYVDPRIHALEKQTTFARTWQFAARADQVRGRHRGDGFQRGERRPDQALLRLEFRKRIRIDHEPPS